MKFSLRWKSHFSDFVCFTMRKVCLNFLKKHKFSPLNARRTPHSGEKPITFRLKKRHQKPLFRYLFGSETFLFHVLRICDNFIGWKSVHLRLNCGGLLYSYLCLICVCICKLCVSETYSVVHYDVSLQTCIIFKTIL